MEETIFKDACAIIDRCYMRHDAVTAKNATARLVDGMKKDNLIDQENANRLLSYSETKYTLGGRK